MAASVSHNGPCSWLFFQARSLWGKIPFKKLRRKKSGRTAGSFVDATPGFSCKDGHWDVIRRKRTLQLFVVDKSNSQGGDKFFGSLYASKFRAVPLCVLVHASLRTFATLSSFSCLEPFPMNLCLFGISLRPKANLFQFFSE